MTSSLSLRRLSAATRLAVVVTVCAALAGAVPGAEPAREAAVAGATSLGTSDQVSRDSADEAITRSTTTVSTRAAVASPDVRSLPSVATSPSDLPTEALDAYVRAAEVIASVKPGCHLSWSVLAAIGQIESDHGRSGGGHLLADGSTSQPVRGRVLDGSGSSQKVADTDGGLLDGITRWDRAVGPMQFLPSTWIAARVDGDGDGVRSPDDMNDASLAAAVFLCSGDDDLATDAGARDALGRYNHTRGYAAAVQALSPAYAAGTYGSYQWQGVPTATWWVPPYVAPSTPEVVRARETTNTRTTTTATTPGASAAQSLVTSPTPAATGTATASPTAASSPTPAGTATATPTPTPVPAKGDPTATGDPTGDSSPSPSPSPSPDPSPDPSPSPSADPPADGPTTTTVSGVLQACGDGAFCVDDTVLALGQLDVPAAADFDGDGTTGTRAAELKALVGTLVKVTVEGATKAGKVVALNGLDWS